MKKIFTLGISILIASMGFSQNNPINFETGGQGANWSWTTFENGINPTLEFVNNPSATGINTSSTVAKFTALQVGNPWAGCESQNGSSIGTFTLTSANAIVKMMVYKPVISDVGIKFATGSLASSGEIKVSNTLVNQWEELTFDFSSKIGEPSSAGIAQIIVFMDFNLAGRSGDNICYFDNITFSGGTALAEPTVAATSPTKVPADVISLFSNVYSNVTVDTWRTSWSSATLIDVQVAGNDVKKYTALDFVGVEAVANQMNVTSMDLFEFDLWTPNSTSFRFKIVDFGANGAFGGGDDVEHETTVVPTLNGWNHIAVPLSGMTGLTTKSNIAQIIFASSPAGTSVVYLDNIMFSKGTVAAVEPTDAAPTPTKLAADVLSMFSNAYTNVTVDTWRTSWSAATLAEVQVAGNDVKKYTGLDFVGVEMVVSQLNVSAMDSFQFDLWTPNSTTFRFKLVDFGADAAFGGGNDVEHETIITPALSGWNRVSVPLTAMTGLTTKSNIAQLIFSSVPAGGSTAFIDNVMFSKKSLVGIGSNKAEVVGIYPNPSTGLLNLKAEKEIQSIVIYNTLGQVVFTSAANSNLVNINIAELPNGFYTVKTSINGVDSFNKIVKE
jgi:hypothetical protein